MRKLFVAIVAGMLLAIPSLAQDATHPSNAPASSAQQNSYSPSPANNAAATPKIAPGSVIPVQLVKTVDAKKAKAGDQVEARVTQDMETGSGEILVPKDTRVIGHVTEAQARKKEDKESQMTIAFDHAMMKDGKDLSLPMSIQAIIAPQTPNAGDNDSATAQPSPTGAGAPSASGRPSGMGNGAGSPQERPTPSAGGGDTGAPPAKSSMPPISANTKGVIGLSDVSLSPAEQGSNSSVISSEKKNVKLESGTLMLLRVVPSNQ
jgi:hypothetical protein